MRVTATTPDSSSQGAPLCVQRSHATSTSAAVSQLQMTRASFRKARPHANPDEARTRTRPRQPGRKRFTPAA
jgi:hypothetical protein